MKKFLSAIAIVLTAVILLTACGNTADTGKSTPTDATDAVSATPTDEEVPVEMTANIGFLQGPTGMGAVYLMEENDAGNTAVKYNIQTSADPTSFTASLINGELDMAALPVNAAATLYAKTGGKVQILAVNTLGVMYILSTDENVKTLADLKGKTIVSAGQGSTPEYVINYLLEENGLEIGTDVKIEYVTEHAEAVTLALSGKYDTVLIPEPFVTKLTQKNGDFTVCVNLTDEWNRLGNGELLTGCIAVRTAFADENPETVSAFLSEYESSVNKVLLNGDEASQLMEKYGIIAAEIGKTALPNCNITFMAGEEMKENVSAYLAVLAEADIASVGGTLPDDGFYRLAADN